MSAAINDIILTRWVIEVNGVQTQFGLYWRLTAIASNPEGWMTNMNYLADSVWNEMSPFMSLDAKLSCLLYYNLSSGEKGIVYPMLAGVGGDSHPTQSVIRFNLYAQPESPDVKRYRGSIHVSGVNEGFSVEGLVSQQDAFQGFLNLLKANFLFAIETDAWTGNVVVRHDRTPPPSLTREYHYGDVSLAVMKPQFMNLGSRRANLCAAT